LIQFSMSRRAVERSGQAAGPIFPWSRRRRFPRRRRRGAIRCVWCSGGSPDAWSRGFRRRGSTFSGGVNSPARWSSCP